MGRKQHRRLYRRLKIRGGVFCSGDSNDTQEETAYAEKLFQADSLSEKDLPIGETVTVPEYQEVLYKLALDEPGYYVIESNDLIFNTSVWLYDDPEKRESFFGKTTTTYELLYFKDVLEPCYLYVKSYADAAVPLTLYKVPVQEMKAGVKYTVSPEKERYLFKIQADEKVPAYSFYHYPINSTVAVDGYFLRDADTGHALDAMWSFSGDSYSIELEPSEICYLWIDSSKLTSEGTICREEDREKTEEEKVIAKFKELEQSNKLPVLYEATNFPVVPTTEIIPEKTQTDYGLEWKIYLKFIPKSSGGYVYVSEEAKRSLIEERIFDSEFRAVGDGDDLTEGNTYYLVLRDDANNYDQIPEKIHLYAGCVDQINLSVEGKLSRNVLYRGVDIIGLDSPEDLNGGYNTLPGISAKLTYSWGETEIVSCAGGRGRLDSGFLNSWIAPMRLRYFLEKSSAEGVYNARIDLFYGRDVFASVPVDATVQVADISEVPMLEKSGKIDAVVNAIGTGCFRFKTGQGTEYSFTDPWLVEDWPYGGHISIGTSWDGHFSSVEEQAEGKRDGNIVTFTLKPNTEYYVFIAPNWNPNGSRFLPEHLLTEMEITVTEKDAEPYPSVTPEVTVTPDPSVTPEVTVTPDPSVTPEVTVTPDPSVTPDPEETPIPTASPEPTETPDVTVTPIPVTPEPTVTPDPTVTPGPSETPTPTQVPSATPTPTPTQVPTVTPTPDITLTPTPAAGTPELKITAEPGTRKVVFHWDSVTDADGYQIFRWNPEKGKYVGLKTILASSGELTYERRFAFGKSYTFRTRSFKLDSDGVTRIYGEFGPEITVEIPQYSKWVRPQVKASVKTARRKVYLDWEKIDGADGYKVYMFNKATKKYDLVKTISDPDVTSYVQSKLNPATTYAFRVRSFVTKEDGTQVDGKISAAAKAVTPSRRAA